MSNHHHIGHLSHSTSDSMVIFTWFSSLFLLLVAYCGTVLIQLILLLSHIKCTNSTSCLCNFVQFRDLALVVELIKPKILKSYNSCNLLKFCAKTDPDLPNVYRKNKERILRNDRRAI